jgi:Squalene-hopene cyclase C-terminal domain
MGGPIHRPPDTGHVDLSMTRYVLEALRAAGVPPSDPAITKALVYLERSQNEDGGFFFSTVNPEINKAGEASGGYLSYGTATADGLLALRAAGIADSDARAVKAINWLKSHHKPDRAPGFDGTARESWGSGLRFYYASVISKAALGLTVNLPPQGPDGSFRNENKMVKEDDPLIATTFAVHTLNEVSLQQ